MLDAKSGKANKEYIKRAQEIVDKAKKGAKDDITKKPITDEAAHAAQMGKLFFKLIEYLKKDKNSEKTKAQIIMDSGPKY